jgi:hypothetical protein
VPRQNAIRVQTGSSVSRTGTFCSADPLAGSPGDPQSWNRYPYGRNDPIDVTDPSGKSWWSDLLIGVEVGAAIFFAPEIVSEIQSFYPTFLEGAGAPAGFTPTLISGAARTAAVVGADVGASTGAGLGSAIAGGAIAAGAAQSTDQSQQNNAFQTALGPIDQDPQHYRETPQNYKPWQMRGPALEYLNSDKDCLHWLNSGGGNAYQLLSKVPLLLQSTRPGSSIGGSTGEPGSPINVSSGGAFYASGGGSIGGFAAGTYGARMTIILHELAHQLFIPGFVDDGGLDTAAAERSINNTSLLRQHCL